MELLRYNKNLPEKCSKKIWKILGFFEDFLPKRYNKLLDFIELATIVFGLLEHHFEGKFHFLDCLHQKILPKKNVGTG